MIILNSPPKIKAKEIATDHQQKQESFNIYLDH